MLARCVHCQKTFDTDRFGVQPCPNCGQQVHLADPSAPPPAPPAPAAYPPGAPGVAWAAAEADAPFAERATLGWIRAYLDTWKLACLQPSLFFRSVKITSPGNAVLFGVISMTVASWFQTLYGALMGAATRGMFQEMLKQVPQGDRFQDTWVVQWMAGATAIGTVAQLIAAPFVSAIWIFIWAGIYQLFLLVLGAASRGFEATLTVVGYASGALLIGAAPVPGLANLVAGTWFIFAASIGFREAQRTTSAKAWAATSLPFLAVCLCCCAAGWMMIFGLSSLKVHGG